MLGCSGSDRRIHVGVTSSSKCWRRSVRAASRPPSGVPTVADAIRSVLDSLVSANGDPDAQSALLQINSDIYTEIKYRPGSVAAYGPSG